MNKKFYVLKNLELHTSALDARQSNVTCSSLWQCEYENKYYMSMRIR